jgi:hypothetical protein
MSDSLGYTTTGYFVLMRVSFILAEPTLTLPFQPIVPEPF